MATAVESPNAVQVKGKILIVDDELVVRDSLGKWFTSEGYTARPVGSGREALEAIQQAEYDIALIDIKMPGMDGMELLRTSRGLLPSGGPMMPSRCMQSRMRAARP